MFGINTITWSEFLTFIALILTAWYILLLLYCRIMSGKSAGEGHFEASHSEITPGDGLQPIAVSSTSFPSKLISCVSENEIPLEVSFYEEIWPKDGIHIDYLMNETSGKLEKLLHEIRYQQ